MDRLAEWIETDGRGGFASGTVGLVRTRRYHAALLTAVTPPTGRFVLVNGFEVWVETPDGCFALSSQSYAGDTVFPDGQSHLRRFVTEPWPQWHFLLPDGTAITHSLFVARSTGDVVMRWSADRAIKLIVRPLLSGRDYHGLHHENPSFDMATQPVGDALLWRPYPGVPAVTARGNFAWIDAPDWYRGFSYAAERERGLDDGEDLASPGLFTWQATEKAVLILRADAPGTNSAATLETEERKRRSRAPRDVAADLYTAARGTGRTLLAGFPWFTDWGRDTFIALRGLLIARGRLQEAAEILLLWTEHVSAGMLPNRFPDGGSVPEYNAVDASLWFVIATHELLEAGDLPVADVTRLRAAVVAILEGFSAGTRFGIQKDEGDGLLRAGVPGVQLTWMDAKVGDRVITPRIGKPVELQALWINALSIAGSWPGGERWVAAAGLAQRSLATLFPDPQTGGLIDVLDVDGIPGARDRRVRPNQVIAAGGLPFAVLSPALVAGVVALTERTLLTPLGLRTLSPNDPEYRPRYAGGPAERDEAYHQGTVWPWLLGPFVAAWLSIRGDAEAARAEARARFLPPLHAHLRAAGLGHVSEVADGAPPHTPGGCPFQAWSMGELIRIETMLGWNERSNEVEHAS